MTFVPAEAFPPGHYIADELAERGWTARDLAERMGGDLPLNALTVDLLIHTHTKGALVGRETAEALGRAFGTSAELWLNLDATWQAHLARQEQP